MRLVTNSGVVALSPNGDHIVAEDEIIEIETPFIVKVAVQKKDLEASKQGASDIGKGLVPMDDAVLRYVFDQGS